MAVGVPYTYTLVTCLQQFFGTQSAQVTAKLVSSATTTCNSQTATLLGAPFEGVTKPTQLTQLLAKWGITRFDSAGNYTLCVTVGSTPTLLPLMMVVKGVVGTSHKIFCLYTSQLTCSARLPGNSMSGASDAKLALVSLSSGTCGTSTLISTFVRVSSTPTASTNTYEIQDFGALAVSPTLTSYKACYCPGYQASSSISACAETPANFVQTVGTLILLSVATTDPVTNVSAALYPRAAVTLSITCGTGGCSTTNSPRIKIVDSNPANLAPYYSPSAGCQAALQSTRYVGPTNCGLTATGCNLVRSDSPMDGRTLTWTGIALDSELVNGVRIARSFDICFCDSECQLSANWLIAGSVQVLSLSVQFLIGGNQVTRPSVNIPGSIGIIGTSAGSFRTNGTQAREMKLLSDNSGAIGSTECATYPQLTTLVSGHDCFSTTNCAVPTVSSTASQYYGNDGLSLLQAGWVAVCFCNAQCTSVNSWTVAGRLLVAGPAGNQKWTVTQNLPFQLTVNGWGFQTTNHVIIVPITSTCGGATQPGYVKGPSQAGAVLADINVAKLEDAGTSTVGGTGTIIYFGTMSGPTLVGAAHGLSDGDYIELTGISSGNVDTNAMLNRNHRVSLVDAYSVIINVVFDTFPQSIDLSQNSWKRTNVAVYTDVVILTPGQYTVCWSPISSVSARDFAGRVGSITVVAPPITYGALGLVTVKPAVAAPIVLEFTTGSSSEYATMRSLKVVFKTPSLFQPLDASGSAIAPGNLSPALNTCGLFFKELSAASGFPYPSGCGFRNDTTSGSPRLEFTMQFSELNGLRPLETYTVVMMGTAAVGLSPVNPSGGPVEVWTMGTDDQDVIEISQLLPSRTVVVDSGNAADVAFTLVGGSVELKGYCLDVGPDSDHACVPCSSESDCGNTDPNARTWCVSPVAFACTNGDPSSFVSFQFQLAVTTGTIAPGSQVRVALLPLAAWNMQLSPLVTCTSGTVGKSCGSGLVSSLAENAVSGLVIGDAVANVLRLNLPLDMDPIDSTTEFTYSVASLALPDNGLLPTHFYVEILAPDSLLADPVFVPSVGQVWRQPSVKEAAIVASDGNDHPFRGDVDNVLYIRLVLGFTLAGSGSAIRIQMPPGYACAEEPVLNCPSSCGHTGVTPKELIVFRTLEPSGRGLLGVRTLEDEARVAAWSKTTSPPSCVLSLMTTTGVYATSSVFIALNVDNPSSALQQGDSANVWTIQATSGLLEVTPLVIPAPPSAKYGRNVAVLGKLTAASIVPSRFAVNAVNDLMIFFRTENACSSAAAVAEVWIEAPTGFTFGSACLVSALSDDYFVAESEVITKPLPTNNGCVGYPLGSLSRYNRAVVATSAALQADTTYAFGLRVINPSTVGSGTWRIATYAGGSACDATFASVRLNPEDPSGGPWSVYSANILPTIRITVADLRPTTDLTTTVTIFPIEVQAPAGENIRISAPAGFVWEFLPSELLYKSTADGGSESDSVAGATASLPISTIPSAPLAEPFNVLLVEYLDSPLLVGKTYGLQAKVRVPRTSPTSSSSVFIIEFGTSTLTEAGIVQAAPVQTLTHGQVDFRTDIASASNLVCVQVKTISPIPRGGSLVITPPTEFSFTQRCVAKPWGFDFASMPPKDSVCDWEYGGAISIVAGPSGIPPNLYRFCLDAVNPSGSPTTVEWTIHSQAIASVDAYLDFPTTVAGFGISTQMDGGFVGAQVGLPGCKTIGANGCSNIEISYWKAGRNDRPGQANQVLVEVAPLVPASGAATISVRAPEGFAFAPDCVVITDAATVLGAGVMVPVDYAAWPIGSAVSDCTGDGRTATVSLANALPTGLRYIFRISVQSNPTTTPLWNYWTTTYNSESSPPVAGFDLWTFQSTSIQSTDPGAGQHGVTVRISFTPFNTIPSSGFLVFTAPSGFVVDTVCAASVEAVPVLCTGTPSPSGRFIITLTGSAMQAGTAYVLSVKVANPQVVIDAKAWLVSSYASVGALLDVSAIPGFATVARLSRFGLSSVSSYAGTEPVSIEFLFQVTTAAVAGDELLFTVPVGYALNGVGRRSCTGYAIAASGISPLSRSPPICVGNSMTWTLAPSEIALQSGVPVTVTVSSTNPPVTPEGNFYLFQHIRNGAVIATATVPGPQLVPKLVLPIVDFARPVAAGAGSPSAIDLYFSTVSPCDTVKVSGTSSVNGDVFGMTSATVLFTAVTSTATSVSVPSVHPGNEQVSLTLFGVLNPATSGGSLWSISTYLGGVLMDQVVGISGPTVLGRIDILGTSSVSPKTYASVGASLTMAFSSTVDIPSGSTVAVTAPSGFSFTNNSFQEVAGIQSSADLISPDNDAVYWIITSVAIRAGATASFALTVDLPTSVQQDTHWRIDVRDVAGTKIATNDGLFVGFALISLLPFGVYPENVTPSAAIIVHISYTVPTAVVGVNTVTMQISAPTGFTFASSTSCLSATSYTVSNDSSSWLSCIGTTNVATLTSNSRTLAAGSGSVDVLLTNPSTTPAVNRWQIVVFADGDQSSYTNIDSASGYSIKAMTASYQGGNRLGIRTPGFFSFQLSANITTYFQLVIAPAVRSGYVLWCTPSYQVGMTTEPVCADSGGEMDAPLTLTISRDELNPSLLFTVGVSVMNPTLPPNDNSFSLTVLSPLGATVDANVKVPSVDLRSVLMTNGGFTFDQAVSRSLTNVVYSVRFDSAVPASAASIIVKITAPDNFIVSTASSVKVATSLTLAAIRPIAVAGNTLTVTLEAQKAVEVGTYTVGFPVMNPAAVPINNVWVLTVYSGAVVLLTAPIEGYQFV